MSNAGLVLGLIAVGVVDGALIAAFASLLFQRRRRNGRPHPAASSLASIDYRALTSLDGDAGVADGVPIAAYDRVVRIAGWAWILSTAILGIAGLFVLVAHDLLPSGALGRAKYLMEGGVSIIFVTLIVLLTGGAASPFFFAFVLIVVGAALVVPPTATVALVVLAAASYLAAIAVELAPGEADIALIAVVGVNLVSLILLAYVAMVVAREQRRTRLAAVRLSTTDALTGLANRAYLIASVEREIERGTRYGRGFCLLMADLDNLKAVNDSYGHRAGDHVLAGVADVIRDGVRRIDTSARLGGDEFMVLLPETDPTGAFVVAEKIRQGVAAMRTVERGGPVPVSVSIGLVAWPDDGEMRDQLMDAVDEAMYAAKQRGRNRIGGPYAGAGEMTPVILPASLARDHRVPVFLGREMNRAG